MVVRPLQRSDYDKGFLQLLGQLTSVGNVSKKQFDGELPNKVNLMNMTKLIPIYFFS